MKFWFFIGPMFNNSNSYGFIFSYTLLWGRPFSFFKCQTYLPRCKLWMDITYYSCKRGKIFFCMFILPYWPRFILPFLIAGMSIVHLLFLHQTGRRNPLGLNRNF